MSKKNRAQQKLTDQKRRKTPPEPMLAKTDESLPVPLVITGRYKLIPVHSNVLAKTDEISLNTIFWYNRIMETKNQIKEVDTHLLDLRYSHTRIKNDTILRKLTNSIQVFGQIVPALAILEQEIYILIDGYKRLAALRACGRDCITLKLTDAEKHDSLFTLLTQNNERKLEAIEQAALIQELHGRFSTSFSEIATRLGRNKSWG